MRVYVCVCVWEGGSPLASIDWGTFSSVCVCGVGLCSDLQSLVQVRVCALWKESEGRSTCGLGGCGHPFTHLVVRTFRRVNF